MYAVYEDHHGSDELVANAARVSFNKLAQYFPPEQNANLIRFLARGVKTSDWNRIVRAIQGLDNDQDVDELLRYVRRIPEHWAPFGHPHITLRMEAPVPIRTQCFKHKIGFVESEESRRYINSRPVLYVPEHFRMKAEDAKQGSGGKHPLSDEWLQDYWSTCNTAIEKYLGMVSDGICPEQARFILPQGCEVHWVWTGSLYAFANFYNQRTDSHAQAEVQRLARSVGEIIAPLYPVSWSALTD